MKKLLFVLAFALCSIISYAQGPTCRVYGENNVATIKNPNVTAGRSIGGGSVDFEIQLSKPASSAIGVVVHVMDGDNIVATSIVYFSAGSKYEAHRIEDRAMEGGKRYRLVIAEASCQ